MAPMYKRLKNSRLWYIETMKYIELGSFVFPLYILAHDIAHSSFLMLDTQVPLPPLILKCSETPCIVK